MKHWPPRRNCARSSYGCRRSGPSSEARISRRWRSSIPDRAGFHHPPSRMLRHLRFLPVPVLARIEGFALGAGMEIAAACDLRLASETARFGMPEVKLGIPSVVEAALLPMLVGWGRTRQNPPSRGDIHGRRGARMGLRRARRPRTVNWTRRSSNGSRRSWPAALARSPCKSASSSIGKSSRRAPPSTPVSRLSLKPGNRRNRSSRWRASLPRRRRESEAAEQGEARPDRRDRRRAEGEEPMREIAPLTSAAGSRWER